MLNKLFQILTFVFLTQPILAQESNYRLQDLKAQETFQKGRYEINGGFSVSTGQAFTYSVLGSLGYFLTDDFELLGQASLAATTDQSATTTSVGGSYYFYKHKAFGLFATQYAGLYNTRSSSWYGETHAGINYLVAPDVSFKFFGQLTYPFEDTSVNDFVFIGSFSYFL